MRVIVEFDVDNDAFRHNDEFAQVMDQALDKILKQLKRNVATVCTAPEEADKVRDSNGNVVGRILIVENDHPAIEFLAEQLHTQDCLNQGYSTGTRWYATRKDLKEKFRDRARELVKAWAEQDARLARLAGA